MARLVVKTGHVQTQTQMPRELIAITMRMENRLVLCSAELPRPAEH